MKKTLAFLSFAIIALSMSAQDPKTIILNPPDLTRGSPVMTALSLRASATEFDTTSLNLQDMSDLLWAAFDAGIVSQNISIFCASVGLDTRVRAWMDKEKLRETLKLKDSQHLMLNHPVGYKKD